MYQIWWVKFVNIPPEKWKVENFLEFWERLRDHMLRNLNVRLEWIIKELE